MTRKLARKNVRTALIAMALSLFLFGLAFVTAAIYISS
jgi:hypothetical protein